MINYSAYSKLYITFSYAYLYLDDRYNSTTISLKLIAYNSSGSSIASTAYKTFANTNGEWEPGATEQTVSVNVSSYNGMGGFLLNLYRYDTTTGTGGTNTTYNLKHTAYIQKIYLA